MDARRVILTLLFAMWLSVQTLVIGVSPAWGFVLPHDHITRGVLSEHAWQEHLREHRLGMTLTYATRCDAPRERATDPVIASLLDTSSAVSIFSLLTGDIHDTRVKIPAFAAPCVSLRATAFLISHYADSPLEPPPNL